MKRLINNNLRFYNKTTFAYIPKEIKSNDESLMSKESKFNNAIKKPKIIIIGAGVSGLSAAEYLLRNGIDNISILEASDRPGGRINTIKVADAVCELGSQWIDGVPHGDNNIEDKKPNSNVNSLFLSSKGIPIDTKTSAIAIQIYKNIEQKSKLYKNIDMESNLNLDEYFKEQIQHVLDLLPPEKKEDTLKVFVSLMNALRETFGTDLTNVNTMMYCNQHEESTTRQRCSNANENVLTPLLKNIPRNLIEYGKPIGSIDWSSNNENIKILCLDDTILQCDYVIYTLSLGVLKNLFEYMFKPKLPAAKVDAIKKLGFGIVEHIYLEYSKQYKSWFTKNINFAWDLEELSDRNNWNSGLCNMSIVPGSKNVLQATVAGFQGEDMLMQSDKFVIDNITETLRKFTGNSEIPYPTQIFRSNWSKDVRFLGSRCYLGINSTLKNIYDLSSPLPLNADVSRPKLLFAGDSTIWNNYGTIQGAISSGIREAERIVELTKLYNGYPID